MRIAIQGLPGCFSEEAALQLHPRAEIVACPDFAGIFQALAEGRAERGLVPVENTIAGPIEEAQALLRLHPVAVKEETRLRIVLCLLLPPAGREATVRRVLSHPVALRQCGRFLARRPNWEAVPFFDTAGSVREMMDRADPELGAIGNARAAAIYGAKVARRGIGDRKANFTRFFLVAPACGRVLMKRAAVEK